MTSSRSSIPKPRSESNRLDFEAAFDQHWAPLCRTLYQLTGDPAEAEDLALEALLQLYRRPPADPSNLSGWLYRVATNLGLRSIRSYKRREHYEMTAGKDALETSGGDRPAEIFENQESRRLARLALAQMNPRRAELLVLRYSGLAYRDIAEVLNLSPTSIGPLLLRAEREFEKKYRTFDQEEA